MALFLSRIPRLTRSAGYALCAMLLFAVPAVAQPGFGDSRAAAPAAIQTAANNRFAATVPVASRQLEDRNAALRDALAAVIRRLAGGELPAATRQLVFEAPQRVLQFYYQTPPPADDGFGPARAQMQLVAEFSPAEITRELELAGVSISAEPPPAIVLWPVQPGVQSPTQSIISERQLGWQLLAADSPLRAAWLAQAADAGIQLRIAQGQLPAAVQAAPPAELDAELVQLSSATGVGRAEVVRIFLAAQNPAENLQRWKRLTAGGASWSAVGPAQGLTELLASLPESTAPSLASPASPPSDFGQPPAVAEFSTMLTITVQNVANLNAYAGAQSALRALPSVSNALLEFAGGGAVRFALALRASEQQFARELVQSGKWQQQSRDVFVWRG